MFRSEIVTEWSSVFLTSPHRDMFSNERNSSKHLEKKRPKKPEALAAAPPESAVTDPGWNFMTSE